LEIVRVATQPAPAARVHESDWGLAALPGLVVARVGAQRLHALTASALFMVAVALYAANRSPSLDDWDSINFAKAVVRFSVADQQPHPPGYPAYVLLASIVNLFMHDPLTSLTLLSALTGAAGVAFLYLLAADLGAPWLALPLATMPLYWLNSEMALTDIPGLAFAIAAVWLLQRAATPGRTTCLLAGCATTGLCAGVRPQVAVVPLAVLALYTAPPLLKAGHWRGLLAGLGTLAAACLAWAIPMALSLEGTPDPLSPFKAQARYVRAADSLLGQPLSWPGVEERVAEFGSILSGYFGGPAQGGIVAFWLLAALAVALMVVSWRTRAAKLAAIWLLAYGILMILVMQPGDPRKALPAVPPLLLLLGAALATRRGPARRRAGLIIGLALTGFFMMKAVPLVHELVHVPAPPEQAAAYIEANFSPDDTLILSETSANHMQYRLPQFASFGIDFIDDVELNQEIASRPYRRVIVLDRWQRPGMPPEFQPSVVALFQRDPAVLPKAARVALTVLEYRV